MTHRIGIIAGDGIGPEVVAEALKAVDAAGVDYVPVAFDLGGARYLRDRRGAARRRPRRDPGHPTRSCWARWARPTSRRACSSAASCCASASTLDLYVNLRPFVAGPSALNDGVDMVVVRENTEGTYAGRGRLPPEGHAARGRDPGLGQHPAGRRALRPLRLRPRADRPRRHVTLVHKTNVLTFAGDLWQRTFDEVAAEHDDDRHRPTTTSTPRASTSCRTPAATT